MANSVSKNAVITPMSSAKRDVKNDVLPGQNYTTRNEPHKFSETSPDTLDSIAAEYADHTGVPQDRAKKLILEANKDAFYANNNRTVAPNTVLKIPPVPKAWVGKSSAKPGAVESADIVLPAPKSAAAITSPRTPNRASDGAVTVVGGDTVNQILRDNGFQLRDANGKDLTPELHAQLKELNPGLDVHNIKPRQKIVLPGQGDAAVEAGKSSAPVATAEQIQKFETQIQMMEQLVGAVPAGPARAAAETELQQMKQALEQLKAGQLPTQEVVDRELAEANGRVAFQNALDGQYESQPGPTKARAEQIEAQANGRAAFDRALNGTGGPQLGPTVERAEKIEALEGQIAHQEANLKYNRGQAENSSRVGNRVSKEQYENAAAGIEKKLTELIGQLEQLKTGN